MARGIVISSTRRFIELYDQSFRHYEGKVTVRDLELCVGDEINFEARGAGSESSNFPAEVSELLPRKNLLLRSVRDKRKLLAANLDLLLMVTAPLPLCNTSMLDRLYASAHREKIPCVLIVNKADLSAELNSSEFILDIYRNLGLEIIALSAKEGLGLEQLVRLLKNPSLSRVALAGVSGVGKSSLLRALLPETQVRTQEVSAKTGQGRQTTSHARAYLYKQERETPLFLIDLPGIQQFGVAHLREDEVSAAFSDFGAIGADCKFVDCKHLEEPECAVKAALEKQLLAESRYRSWVDIRRELAEQKEFSWRRSGE